MLPPALKSAMSIPVNAVFVSSLTVISSTRNLSFLPAERAEASNVNFPTGKLRFSSVLIISTPTAPVAPTTATCGLRFIQRGRIYWPAQAASNLAFKFAFCCLVSILQARPTVKSTPISPFQRSIQVGYQLRVHFTQNAFNPVNRLLAEILSNGEE